MTLIRFLLIGFAVFLIVRSFIQYAGIEDSSTNNREPEKKDRTPVKKISKEVGEYIDYEEIDKKTG